MGSVPILLVLWTVSPNTALYARIDSLVERIGNPVVRNAEDLGAVRRLCDSCIAASEAVRTPDPELDARFRDLYDVAYLIREAFLDLTYEPAGEPFLLAAPGLAASQRAEVARAMLDEYARVKALLTDSAGIRMPEGRIMVLVPIRISDEFSEMLEWGRERLGAMTVLCKWVMTPVEVVRGSEVKDGYPQLREYLRHELTHVFVNSSAGTRVAKSLPVWFDEMVTTNAVGVRRGLARSYKEYLALGHHIRRRFGDPKYYEFVRRVIEKGSANDALRDVLGYASYEALKADFSRTVRVRDFRWWLAVLAVLVALVAYVRIRSFLRLRNEFRTELAAARAAWDGRRWREAVNGYDGLGQVRYERFLSPAILKEAAERRPVALTKEFNELLHQAEAAHNQKDWEHAAHLCGTLLGDRFTSCRSEKAEHRIHDLWLSSEFRTKLWQARKAYDAEKWLEAADCYDELVAERFEPVRHLARENEVETRRKEARAYSFVALIEKLREAAAAGDRDKAGPLAAELNREEFEEFKTDDDDDLVDETLERPEAEETENDEDTMPV